MKDTEKTLRDEFAMAALAGIEAAQGNNGQYLPVLEAIAKRAYSLADAMLAEREKPCPTKT